MNQVSAGSNPADHPKFRGIMDRATLAKAVIQGLSTRDLAKQFGTSQTNVRHHLRKHGLVTASRRSARLKRKKATCLFCKVSDVVNKFCSNRCQWDYDLDQWTNKWLRDEVVTPSDGTGRVKNALILVVGNKCEKCGWCEKHPVTGNVPVQLHHKDGDDLNNRRDNVQLLCPNCHSLTPNYAALNVRKTPKPYIRNPKNRVS